MKPVAFEYSAPGSIDELLAMLSEYGDDAKILAGGQSLVPMLNFRLVRPARIIDINQVGSLAHVRKENGSLFLGALARTGDLERSKIVQRDWPILRESALHIGHPAIRNRGTICGSASHADANAELPVVLAVLDARMHIRSNRGSRIELAKDFFIAPLITLLEADEVLTQIEIRALPSRSGTAFVEYARKKGDFALAGAAAVICLSAEGICEQAAIAILGANFSPLRLAAVEAAIIGANLQYGRVQIILKEFCSTLSLPDPQAYRRSLIEQLTVSAVMTAAARAATI